MSLKNRRKNNLLNAEKKIIITNKSMINIKSGKNKDESPSCISDTLNKYIENLKTIIKKNIFQEIILKQLNPILNKISDFIKEINSQIIQYQNLLIYNETKLRGLQSKLFSELLNKDILQNNIKNLSQKEKDFELIKEKTGIIVNNGKIINTNRKDNEIIILRTENSTLKGVIEEYETKLLEKEKEFKKINMNLMKQKNDLILKIHNLNNQIKNNKNNKYSRYNISKKKLTINNNNKKSIDFSGTIINESNDIIFNNPSTINAVKTNENNYYIDSNISRLYDIKMNTISTTHIHTINHSHKNSNFNTKIKNKLELLDYENDDIIKGEEKNNYKTNHTIVNKTSYQNTKFKLKKKKNTNKTLINHIYNKIIVKEDYNTKNDNNSKKTKEARTKTKSQDENHLLNVDDYWYKKDKFLNSYFNKNKPIKHIIHKKNKSNKINTIPFNNVQNGEISNKENKNDSNLINIKNLILSKAQKNKKNKIHLIYRNLVSNSISNSNSINNLRNLIIKNNMSKIYAYNISKAPTPKSFIKN